MSEQALLRWMQALDGRLDALGAEVAKIQQSLAACQVKHAGERGLSLRRRGTLIKVFVGLAVAVAGALADRLTNRWTEQTTMANETAITGPLQGALHAAATLTAMRAVEHSLEPELGGGFDVDAEATAAGLKALVGQDAATLGPLLTMVAAMDARFAPRARKVTAVAQATYDLVAGDDILQVDYTATAAVTNLRLMTALMVPGYTVTISDTGGGADTKNITITTEGDEKIAGLDTYVIAAAGGWVTLAVNAAGTGWIIAGKG